MSASEIGGLGPRSGTGEEDMRWTTSVIVETCIGMEVTSYASAAI
jgi:coenzyme PQQ precursor peptide PqqA